MANLLDLFFSGHAGWFTLAAVIGTAVFVLRLVLLLAGLAGHDLDLELPADVGDIHHGDPGDAFKLLSIQSIAAMLMGFGWGGLGALKGAGLPMPISLVVAALTGGGMVWLLAALLGAVRGLEGSGNIPPQAALGVEGVVYANVPGKGDGLGQVRVVVTGRQRILNAMSDEQPILTQTRVRVLAVNPDNTVTVRAVEAPA